MTRQLSRCALAATLTSVGCFSEAGISGSAEAGGSSGGSEEASTATGTGSSGGSTTAETESSPSGTATSVGPADTGDLTGSTTGGSETTAGTEVGSGSSSSDSGVQPPTVCPSFFDTFDDGLVDPLWRRSFPASTTEVDGELVIAVTGALNDEYVTMVVQPERGGLEGGTLRIELGTVPADPGVRTTLWVQPNVNAGRISFNLADRNDVLRLEARITPEMGSPFVASTLPWDSTTMHWLQLREAEGVLYFETSTDGVTFETFYEMVTPFDLGAAEVGFAGHNDLALANDVEVSVRTFEFICG